MSMQVNLPSKTLLMAAVISICSCSAIRGSEIGVRNRYLEITPIGSSFSEVEAVVKNRTTDINLSEYGVAIRNLGGERVYTQFRNNADEVIGVKSIHAYLGHYQGFPWRVDVIAHWAFDEKDKLIDLVIEKQYDAL